MDGTVELQGTMLRPAIDDVDQLVAPLTDAETRVAQALAGLGDGWTVYVQPRIGLDQPDFIAMHDRYGACAIEVKSWEPHAVRRNEYSEFEFLIGDDWHRSAEQPRFEASRYRSTIFDQFFAMPEDGGAPPPQVRAMVVLPNFTTTDAAELLADWIDDAEEFVAVWGGDVLDDVANAVRGPECDPPRPASMTRLHEHVVPSERITLPDDHHVPLSAGALDIATNPLGLATRRVRGAAGSGKTFGLTARAARLAAESKRVLVLSFNVTLANRLQNMVTDRCREVGANPTLVTCANFHTLCTRIVQDAEVAGYIMNPPAGAPWTVAIVSKVEQAFDQGFQRSYDAILVDEGQDYTADWWQLLRTRVLAPGGEMLVVADPTQDLYSRFSWTRKAEAEADVDVDVDVEVETDVEADVERDVDVAWIDLGGAYRVPSDLAPFLNDLAAQANTLERLPIEVADDHDAITGGRSNESRRHWTDVERVNDLGRAVGREVVRILETHPELSPGDVTFLCEYHHDGVAAVRVIERAGYPVHHIFSRDPDAPRRRRKHRFWPGVPAVKGCTVHSFKGWETPALVVGIGTESRAERAAYVSLTRTVSPENGNPAVVSIVNANRGLASRASEFTAGSVVPPAVDGRDTPAPRPIAPPDTPAPFSAPSVFAATAEHPLNDPESAHPAPHPPAGPQFGYTPPVAPIVPARPPIDELPQVADRSFAAPSSPPVAGAFAPPTPGMAGPDGLIEPPVPVPVPVSEDAHA